MKYFTRDLQERYGSEDDAVADAANAEWEAVLERYERYLQTIANELPEQVRHFTELRLHDAVIWSIVRQANKLIMILHKDVPPRDVVILTYTLTQEPVIDKEALPAAHRCSTMDFQYDEFELLRDGDRANYAQSIVFGNGWEMSLRFSDVEVALAEPVYPLAGTRLIPVSGGVTAKSA
jgi:hypothetical protein